MAGWPPPLPALARRQWLERLPLSRLSVRTRPVSTQKPPEVEQLGRFPHKKLGEMHPRLGRELAHETSSCGYLLTCEIIGTLHDRQEAHISARPWHACPPQPRPRD